MIALAVLVIAQSSAHPLYVAEDEVAYLPGQLEVVNGIHPCSDTVMSLNYANETQPKFALNGIAGQVYVSYNFGWVRFATAEETFLGLKVWHLRWAGRTISHHGKKEYVLDATTDYWVDKEGKIRRETSSKTSVYGHSEALCDFFPDHIQIQHIIDGKSSEQLLYPAHDELQQLNDQFKPMVIDGQILLREKTFMVLDPYKGTFEKRTARIAGHFGGKELDTEFHGHEVDIEMNKTKQGVCVSDDNDLVRVDLQNGKAMVMTVLPENRQKDSQ